MKRVIIILNFLFVLFLSAWPQASWMNVAGSGADRSGKIKCTGIINNLIDTLSGKGGGTLYFPAGTYLTGPIILKSNIILYLDAGAVIKFSDDFDDYLPMVPSRWEDVRVKNFKSQIYAYRCENITITGRGHFEGQGQKWWDFMRQVNSEKQSESKWQEIFKRENAELLSRNEYLRSKNNFLRPPMVTTYECKNVLIEGVSFSNPPFWTIMPAFTDNIIINGITIENPGNSPNTDGIDPSSCRNVRISNCHITVGDDCIVIKSGRDEDGREAGKPTENVTITNCTMLEGHGGVVIGSEMSGGVRKIAISNCVFEGTERGIRIKTMRGRGGVIEDIVVSNIVMNNIINEGVLITLRYQTTKPEPLSERTPACKNVRISDLIIRGARRPVAVYGLEEMDVSGISLNSMEASSQQGIIIENVSDISLHDIKLEITGGSAFEAKDSKKISCDRISASLKTESKPYFIFQNSQDIRVTNCYQSEIINLYMSEDEKCESIYLVNNILPGVKMLYNKKGKNIITGNNFLKSEN